MATAYSPLVNFLLNFIRVHEAQCYAIIMVHQFGKSYTYIDDTSDSLKNDNLLALLFVHLYDQ